MEIFVLDALNYTAGWKWLVDIIGGLIKVASSVGLGIILFTLILKLITLPLDIWSRVSMRKNSLKMEEMRPQLEKLQKQYADNKQLYNQKMTALYKKNGYSMLGGCLPTLVTLVFFFIALTGFNKYSIYQNTEIYSKMNQSYSQVAYDNFIKESVKDESGENYLILNDGKKFKFEINHNAIKNIIGNTEEGVLYYIKDGKKANETDYEFSVKYTSENINDNVKKYIEYDANNLLISKVVYDLDENNEIVANKPSFYTVEERIDKDGDFISFKKGIEDKSITVDVEDSNKLNNTDNNPENENYIYKYYFKTLQRKASAEAFRSFNEGFLWVKNIWITDSPFEKTVFTSVSKLKSKLSVKMNESDYEEITHDLGKEKSQPNGYLIMVLLTIGSSILSQWISTKGQKAQLELQSVDGKGAQQQKMMMVMMPVIMAIFAFMYTAAFSIYIVFSSLFSTLSTVIINKSVEKKFEKEKQNKAKDNDKRIVGKTIVENKKDME